MKNQLTVLIPTSPIPSHPSTAILDETISNIRKYTDAKIIIMLDGVHSSLEHRREQYNQYRDSVIQKMTAMEYGDCNAIIFDAHEHQARMTRKTLESVKTPLIMFCEHDTSPIGDIQFSDMCAWVATDPQINCIRFNIFDKIPVEHSYLMLNDGKVEVGGCSYRMLYVRTIQWSQRPHIAKTQWYRDILNDFFKHDAKTMIEDVMHSVVQVTYEAMKKDVFGLAIYTPEGNQLRSYHSDARQQDTKIIEG